MGMLDSELVLSAAESTAAFAVGDNASTNTYDMGSLNAEEAAQTNENLWINVICNALFAGATATVQAVFQDSVDDATWVDRLAGPVIVATTVLVGGVLLQAQPPIGTQRYWRTIIRVAVANLTAGAIDSYVSNTIQHNIQRPAGFTVA